MRRTSVITAASIVGVVLAGLLALGANIGILSSADDSAVGQLGATGDLVPTGSALVVSTPPSRSAASSGGTSTGQEFAVDEAGVVTVEPTPTGVSLAGVVASEGWSWHMTQPDPASLKVTFASASRTLDFTVTRDRDGNVVGAIEDHASDPSASSATRIDDDHEDDDEHDGTHDRSDDHDRYEHEGRDDDD